MGAGGVIVPPATYFERIQPILQEVRHPVRRRRGDLRLRPHGQHVRLADVRSSTRHHHRGEGAVVGLRADLGARSCRTRCTRSCSRKATSSASSATATRTRRIRCPRRSRSRRCKIYEERDIVEPACARVGAAAAGGHPQLRRPSADRRCARHRPHRRGRARARQGARAQSFDPKAGVGGVSSYAARSSTASILRNMPGDIVAFCPPLIISEAEIDEMMAGFGKALDDTWAMVKEKGLA